MATDFNTQVAVTPVGKPVTDGEIVLTLDSNKGEAPSRQGGGPWH